MIFFENNEGTLSIYESVGKKNIDGYGDLYCESRKIYDQHPKNQFSEMLGEDEYGEFYIEEIGCYKIEENGDIVLVGYIKNEEFEPKTSPSFSLPNSLIQGKYNSENGECNIPGQADVTINEKIYKDCVLVEKGSVVKNGDRTSAVLYTTYYYMGMGPVYIEGRTLIIEGENENYESGCSFQDNLPGADISLFEALKKVGVIRNIENVEYKYSMNRDGRMYY